MLRRRAGSVGDGWAEGERVLGGDYVRRAGGRVLLRDQEGFGIDPLAIIAGQGRFSQPGLEMAVRVIFCRIKEDCHQGVVAKWLMRLTRNQFPSGA